MGNTPEIPFDSVKDAIIRTGSICGAAELLGATPAALSKRVKKSKQLSKLISPLDESETLHREDKKEITKYTSEEAITRAMDAEDAALKKGLKSIGLKGGALKEAVALQAFHNTQFQKSYEMIGGGITKLFFDLKAEVTRISERLSEGGIELEEENMLRNDRSKLIEALGKAYDRAQKAAMTQAVIKHRLSDDSNSAGPRGKPGFAPIQNVIAIKAENGKVIVDAGKSGK